MKDLLRYGVGLFVLFSLIGYLHGRQIRNDPTALRRFALTHISIIKSPQAQPSNSRDSVQADKHGLSQTLISQFRFVNTDESSWEIKLVYSCPLPIQDERKTLPKDKIYYTWYVGKKTLERVQEDKYLDWQTEGKYEIPISESQAASFLGGATGAWTIKDAIKFYEENQKNRVVLGIVGIFSGYLVGNYLGTAESTRCDSPQILNLMNQKSKWDGGLDRYILKEAIANAAIAIRKTERPEIADPKLTELSSLSYKVEDETQPVTNDSFLLVDRLEGGAQAFGFWAAAAKPSRWDIVKEYLTYGCVGFVLFALIFAAYQKWSESSKSTKKVKQNKTLKKR